jgi:uncharacterized protein (TIGR03067 family)
MSGILSLSLLVVAAAHAEDDSAKKELARLDGTWKFVKVEAPDKIAEAMASASVVQFQGNKMKITVSTDRKVVHEAKIALDPGKKPKTMDITALDGPTKGETDKWIYELDGDTLKMACDPQGERPGDFTYKKGSSRQVYTLKRVKK